ncbi:cell wall biogenesis and architecture protein [Coemansia spiralis]|uniref:3-methyl-2-oxobutanoate hydroxymethyltransferase n=2 Tax=Coemansia TaxID=4863 RepID=A0A9W8G934_9FUNG|nr:cell wall biogenesis and architecture protein [Coemansia umbellata]KAJ2625638.1 cell wall biogenesis and architecture protein [Coemansia sp. RSA 1358]KAJ2678768.1 cell wall biogenesis and architecture protein [Coemansia spiralis]
MGHYMLISAATAAMAATRTAARIAQTRTILAAARAYSARPASAKDITDRPKVTTQTIKKLYTDGKPIAMMTAYDYPTAVACERAGVDMVLVGDSLAMVALGHENTSEVTMDDMIHHSKAVSRGMRSAFLVTDLPFGSYQSDETSAVNNAIRMIKEGRAEALKLEVGHRGAPKVDAIVNGAGIPVVGHIGLTPQSAVALGGFRVQGKSVRNAQALVDDALALQDAGCLAIVLEAMPSLVAETITKLLRIPTIGIGAGSSTSGQVLVLSDMVGVFDRFTPKFCQNYADLGPRMAAAIGEYNKSVRAGTFPIEGVHTYAMPATAEENWRAYVQKQFGLELGSRKSPLDNASSNGSASEAKQIASVSVKSTSA